MTKNWPEDWHIRLIQLLAVPGMFVAFYLLLYHNGNLINVCKASGWDDCGKVSGPTAPYSAIGPIPVALIGLVGYITIFLVSWLQEWLAIVDDYLPELMVGLTGLALLFSLGLTALEIFVIHAVCRFCIISALIIVVMFVLSIGYMRSLSAQDG